MSQMVLSGHAVLRRFRVWLSFLFAAALLVGGAEQIDAAVATHKVRMYTNMGPVEIELYSNESPLHVANFLTYVDAGDYDDSFIHRTRAYNPSQPYSHDLFVQGGSYNVPTGQFIDGNPIVPRSPVPNEFNAANGLTNSPGSLAAARMSDPDSATSGWFINQSNNSASFDSGPYTVFGQVTSGMSIVDQIPFLPNYPPFQGTAFESLPVYNGGLVVIERVARIPLLPGDFNSSGVVNAGDYTFWRTRFGSTSNAAADGNGNGVVDAADYVLWRKASGQTGSGAAMAGVPEPSVGVLLFMALLPFIPQRRLLRRR